MPIYEYRCAECGFQDEYLQKLSEPQLTVCPSCGKTSFQKQLSAAGFQLKGSGWYATDFRGGGKPESKPEGKGEAKPAESKAAEPASDSKPGSDSKPASKTDAAAEPVKSAPPTATTH